MKEIRSVGGSEYLKPEGYPTYILSMNMRNGILFQAYMHVPWLLYFGSPDLANSGSLRCVSQLANQFLSFILFWQSGVKYTTQYII